MATGSWRGHLMRETVLHVLYRENICIPSYDYLWKGYSIKFCKQFEYLLENILMQFITFGMLCETDLNYLPLILN